MNPHLLQELDDRLGNPAWFWPVVMTLLFVLIVLGSSISPECA